MSTDLIEYRRRAESWVAANLVLRQDSPYAPADPHERYTPDYIAAQRVLQRQLFDGGYAGITWPVEYGGQGLTLEHEREFREAAADYLTPELGTMESTTFGCCGPTIVACAAEEVKQRHVPRILKGEELWAQFFSEPAAGSDLAGIVTKATRDGDDWVINGSKVWTSGAWLADYGLCLVRTDPTAPKHQGLTWFAVPTNAEGVVIRRIKQIDGTSGFCEVFLTDVRIPDSERVGGVNEGWPVARVMLVFERDAGVNNSIQPSPDPGPIAPDLMALARSAGRQHEDAVQLLIAKAHTDDYVRAQLPARVGDTLTGSASELGAAAFGKLGAGTTLPIRARIGMLIGGSSAIAWLDESSPGKVAADAYLNGRIMAIAGGSNQMQRNGISEAILGLPREPKISNAGTSG